jgi:hypothetical protein
VEEGKPLFVLSQGRWIQTRDSECLLGTMEFLFVGFRYLRGEIK